MIRKLLHEKTLNGTHWTMDITEAERTGRLSRAFVVRYHYANGNYVAPITAPTQDLPMGSYKDPSFEDRRSDATKAKKTTLAKFRESPGPDDPLTIKKGRERAAIAAARAARSAERDLARQTQEAEVVVQAKIAAEAERHLAEQAAREATEQVERDAALKAEQVEREAALNAEQKAARDARYAARKAAKKERRRGY